jgi:rubrerythrin
VKENIMKTSVDIGTNRTGMSAAPALSKQMIRSSHDGLESPTPDRDEARTIRIAYAKAAPPVGTVPPPTSVKGAVKTALKALAGEKATVFIDKLAERLAFERMGVRLYEALLLKLDAKGRMPGGPSREELQEIHEDEQRHFALVHAAIEDLGADPTVQTPSADLEGVASLGLLQILTDPRTDLREGIQAILHAEAADRDGWELLITLAEGLEQDDLASTFEAALRTEETHLIRVRGWLTAMTQHQAFGKVLEPAAPSLGETVAERSVPGPKKPKGGGRSASRVRKAAPSRRESSSGRASGTRQRARSGGGRRSAARSGRR